MKRRIIQIDEDKCSGCGLCVSACHEGAIQMVDGKAKLIRDDYCDGLGDCLPSCPENAISFVEREAAAYDEAAVQAAMQARKQEEVAAGLSRQAGVPMPMLTANPAVAPMPMPNMGGCPGSAARRIQHEQQAAPEKSRDTDERGGIFVPVPSELTTWPIQIKLANPQAAYLNNAPLLVAADCTAFAYGAFHNDFLKDRVCVIGCPKLDGVDYSQKLGEIIALNNITDVLVTRMQVPCCGGLENAVREAIATCGHDVKLNVVTIASDGSIVGETD